MTDHHYLHVYAPTAEKWLLCRIMEVLCLVWFNVIRPIYVTNLAGMICELYVGPWHVIRDSTGLLWAVHTGGDIGRRWEAGQHHFCLLLPSNESVKTNLCSAIHCRQIRGSKGKWKMLIFYHSRTLMWISTTALQICIDFWSGLLTDLCQILWLRTDRLVFRLIGIQDPFSTFPALRDLAFLYIK